MHSIVANYPGAGRSVKKFFGRQNCSNPCSKRPVLLVPFGQERLRTVFISGYRTKTYGHKCSNDKTLQNALLLFTRRKSQVQVLYRPVLCQLISCQIGPCLDAIRSK